MFRIARQVLRAGIATEASPDTDETLRVAAEHVQREVLATLGRALAIRHVDAGSCNGCELEIHALSNPYYNLEGFGIRFVASPRHADMLLVTGPVTHNMELALKRTFEAVPDPKLVVALGDCAGCGGIFGRGYAITGSIADVIPVDVVVPGCPPAPLEILRGILTAVRAPRNGAKAR
jgi:Ni,Fe-hydrogenase III small subunit